jgi:PTS system ascorbate-specific IIA component
MNSAPGDLNEILHRSMVRARLKAASWEEAVEQAGRLLVDAGSCESRYVSAMADAVREIGPYIVVAPGVAMPHARPEQGVRRPAVAVVTLERPVEFGHRANDPVDLVIAFAALDKNAHLVTLQSISHLLMNQESLARVRAADSDQELWAGLGIAPSTHGTKE